MALTLIHPKIRYGQTSPSISTMNPSTAIGIIIPGEYNNCYKIQTAIATPAMRNWKRIITSLSSWRTPSEYFELFKLERTSIVQGKLFILRIPSRKQYSILTCISVSRDGETDLWSDVLVVSGFELYGKLKISGTEEEKEEQKKEKDEEERIKRRIERHTEKKQSTRDPDMVLHLEGKTRDDD